MMHWKTIESDLEREKSPFDLKVTQACQEFARYNRKIIIYLNQFLNAMI